MRSPMRPTRPLPTGEAGAVINNVTYSEDWTKEQAQYISDRLPDFIDNMMLILGGNVP